PSNESEREFAKDKEELKTRVTQSEVEREKLQQMTVWDFKRQGDRYYNSGEYENAIKYYDKVIELRSTAGAYYDRGSTYTELGEEDKALLDFDKAIELNPNYADAYYDRGSTYTELGEEDKALLDFDKAIEL